MKKKLFIQILGSVSYALTQWLIIFYITRYIGVDQAGLYLYFLSIFTPLSILLNYGIRNSIATDQNSSFSIEQYKGLSNISFILYLIVGILIFLFIKENFILFLFVFLFKLNEILMEPINGYFIQQGKSFFYAYSKILRLIAGLIIFLLFYIIFGEKLALIGYLFALYFIYYFYDRKNGKYFLYAKGDYTKIFKIIKLNTPLVISSFIVALNTSIPRWLLSENDMVSLAIFGILMSFSSMACLPVTSASQILFSKKKDFFTNYLTKLNILIVTYIILYFLFTIFMLNWILHFIYKIEITLDNVTILISSLIGCVQITIVWLNFFLLKERKFNLVLLVSVSSLVVLLISYFILINLFTPLNTTILAVLISGVFNVCFNSYLNKVKV
ncbi:hypothetical protein [Acinetobacter sp. UBA1297]|uniref:hypothetical protein n=1 Tax=Acinetobacter sp. UBA1297 TaxID=1945925 RepID=UPI002580C582|nr:hypothetical protein [Acinetobacter sp. UBA1297]